MLIGQLIMMSIVCVSLNLIACTLVDLILILLVLGIRFHSM